MAIDQQLFSTMLAFLPLSALLATETTWVGPISSIHNGACPVPNGPIAQSIYTPAKSEQAQLSRNRFDDNIVGRYKGAVSGLFSWLVSTVVALIRIRDFDTAGQLPLALKFLSACLLCCWWSRGGYLLGRKIPRKPARGSLGFIEGALNLVGSLQAGERCTTSKNKRNQNEQNSTQQASTSARACRPALLNEQAEL